MNPNVKVFEGLSRHWAYLSTKYSLLSALPGIRRLFGGKDLLQRKAVHAHDKRKMCDELAHAYAMNPNLQLEA